MLSCESVKRMLMLPRALLRASTGSLLEPLALEMSSLVSSGLLAVGNLELHLQFQERMPSASNSLPMHQTQGNHGKVLVIPQRSLLFGALMERTPHLLQPNTAKAADRMADGMFQVGMLLVVLLDPNGS
mmetsp:Transcript_44041/g.64628  ORF Transcript_44041/g.64628 Transcript_44041/m.64628 type:complete len:129 (+) Transcript_44041:4228-4614(+)